jgi:peptide/nickel transport system permease protein
MPQTSTTMLASDGIAADVFDIALPTPRQAMLRRARSHFGLLLGGTVVLAMVAAALFASAIAPAGPYEQDLGHRLADAVWGAHGSWAHPLGTDALGRDVLSRLIYGTRVSLTVGFCGAAIAGAIGTLLGLVGGYFGGRVDAVVVYLLNVKLALPIVLVSLAIIQIVSASMTTLIVILGFLTWDRYAVVTRAATQQLAGQEFVLAAQAAGASHLRIIFGELLPNLANQIIVVTTLEVAILIGIEAALSFLGLGVPAPTPSWGIMIAEGRSMMFFKPHLIVIPGLAIFLLVMAINLVGDGVRDVTAPEARN